MTMPQLIPLNELRLHSGETFVIAAGFEERALVFPSLLQPSQDGQSNAVLLEYVPHHEKNKSKEIQQVLSRKACSIRCIPYNRYSPNGFDVNLKNSLLSLETEAICLDISGLSRLALMVILDVVRELNLPLRIVYAEACRYAPSKEDFEAAKQAEQQHLPTSFIHTGVYDVLHVSRLSSIRMQNHAALLIAFDSFNEALCQALINVINFSRFILVNGTPPRQELQWREEATVYVHQFLRREWSIEDDNDPIKTTSTLYYEETYRLLVNLYWMFSNSHRIILAPTGSKMQTLGAYLVRAVHNDVHIEYPTVQGFFADKYSTGVRETWKIDFGKMGDFVEHLRRIEIEEHLGLPRDTVDVDID